MKKKLLLTAILAVAGSSLAQEKTLTLKISQPLELYGGISGLATYSTNEGGLRYDTNIRLSNAVVGITGGSGPVSFDLALGSLLAPSVWDGGVHNSMISYTSGSPVNNEAGILWGYASFSPIDMVSLDIGYLATNVGAEVINTYANNSITLGAVWFAQPVIYPGVRLNVNVNDDISLYAEYNKDSINPRTSKDAFAVGSLGSVAGIDYAVSYYDYSGFKNLVDVVLGTSLGTIDLGLNFDYQWLDDSAKQKGKDDTGFGIALYVTPTLLENVTLPVRAEYFSDGTSDIYTADAKKGLTFTLTPTYKPTENSFVRAEVAYIATDEKAFKNNTEKNKTTFALEVGLTF